MNFHPLLTAAAGAQRLLSLLPGEAQNRHHWSRCILVLDALTMPAPVLLIMLLEQSTCVGVKTAGSVANIEVVVQQSLSSLSQLSCRLFEVERSMISAQEKLPFAEVGSKSGKFPG